MARSLIVGNLDAEAEMARTGGARPRATSEVALRAASALATLLRVFADDGDLLWTPRQVEADRVTDVPGLARPELITGPLPTGEIAFAWAETASVAKARDGRGPCSAETAARVNHRGFLLEAADAFPDRLDGARLVRSLDEVRDGPVVLKAPWSAAGRLRVIATPRFGKGDRARIFALLDRYGVLVLEPWLDRTADFGCCGRVDGDGVSLHSPHRLLTDDGGAFLGVEGPLPDPEAGRVESAARRAGELLEAAGYRGRFGIDGLRGRDPLGANRLHLPCELNARTTFGHVAAALADRLGRAGRPFALRIGRDLPDEGVLLLRAGTGDDREVRFLG